MAVGDSIGESPSPTMPSWCFMGLTAKADARWQYTHPYGPGELAVCKDVLYRATTSHANLWPVTHPTAWEPLTVPLTDSPGEFLCPIVSCWGCGSAFAPVSVTPYNGKMLNVFFQCVGCGLGMGVPVKPAPDPVLGEDFDEVRLVYFKRAKGS